MVKELVGWEISLRNLMTRSFFDCNNFFKRRRGENRSFLIGNQTEGFQTKKYQHHNRSNSRNIVVARGYNSNTWIQAVTNGKHCRCCRCSFVEIGLKFCYRVPALRSEGYL
jgi:hypothetical protein